MGMKYENEVVSVIIPVYNAANYIEKTILSVEKQSYKKVEIVVIDDCSKDHSREIIKKLSEMYSNIVYHLQESNQGVAVARTTSILS